MPAKAKGARKPIKFKGVRAENAPSLAPSQPQRAVKPRAISRGGRLSPRPDSISTSSPLTEVRPDEAPEVLGTAVYGASWASPSPAVVSSLSEEDTLLLRGISPGSTSAQWYRSLSHQLSRRALESVVEPQGRPASANAALVIPHTLIDLKSDERVPRSQPSSPPSHYRQPRGEAEADANLPTTPKAPPAPRPMPSAAEDDEELPIWLRSDDAAPTAVTPERSPPGNKGGRRRTDFDRLQSLRRMMEVNHNAADTFSSATTGGSENGAPSSQHDEKLAPKRRGHHLPPLAPSTAHPAASSAVEIAMSQGSDSSLFRRHFSSREGLPSSEDHDAVVSDDRTVLSTSANILDLRALRKDLPFSPSSAPPTSGRVVVMSLGNIRASPGLPASAGLHHVQGVGVTRDAWPYAADISPVELMAPNLRAKRQQALARAKGKKALPPIS